MAARSLKLLGLMLSEMRVCEAQANADKIAGNHFWNGTAICI
jgi:hypothetical protein